MALIFLSEEITKQFTDVLTEETAPCILYRKRYCLVFCTKK